MRLYKLLLFIGGIPTFGSFAQTHQFTTVGNATFTIPPHVLSVKVEAIGGGGGGGRVRGSSARESGGGGGGAYAHGIINVIPGNIYNVGVGNAGVQNDNTAVHGGNSYFGVASSTNDSLTVLAEGGRSIILSDGSQAAGADGGKASNSVGNRGKYNGGNGGETNNNDYGGGGGGAAGSTGNGGNGGEGTAGLGTSSYGGNGGQGGVSGGDDDGSEGYNYGGGGGGARKSFSGVTVNRYGAAGAQGIVIVSWCTISAVSPLSVCASSGNVIEVKGTNLSVIDSVQINGINVPFTALNDTTFTINSFTGVSSGNIIVFTPNGSSESEDILTILNNQVSISQQGVTLTANYTGNTTTASFQWINCVAGNSPIPGANQSTYTAVQNSLYAVQVTENGCIITSDCFLISTVGIEENDSENEWNVYPNPAQNQVTIKHNSIIPSSVSIFNIIGGRVLQSKVVSQETILSLSDLNSGTYLIKITTEKGIISKKIFVK